MKRRHFIQALSALALIGCKQKKIIRGKIIGASANIGHLLRDGVSSAPVETIRKKVVIVGGGVSGLSAARYLQQQGITDFLLLDLEQQAGGNAAYGSNAVSAYPWGAHYIPVPNNTLTEYKEFLQEAGAITGINADGLPVYNEYYLCFEPQERLYINGQWQEGLIPVAGDKAQTERFLQLMQGYRTAIGKDGKEAFALPVDLSSKDESFTKLDNITMKQWMQEQGFNSPYLHWYINYCTRDDYGTSFDQVSAWAGIHYFACRKGRGANAEHHDVLTWPEGNGWLVQQLQKHTHQNFLPQSLALSVTEANNKVTVNYLDVRTKTVKAIVAEQCILAVPQFIAARLLQDAERAATVKTHLHYAPWMVANLTVTALEERNGAPLSWDNVIYESNSLGYVVATHQLLDQHLPRHNLTYYLPLLDHPPAEARKIAQTKTHEQWVDIIINDLKKLHPNIGSAIEEVNIMLWGHAMAQPLPGLIHGPVRASLSASINHCIHFAHTDVAGVSLFEEAFYQGLNAAKKAQQLLTQ